MKIEFDQIIALVVICIAAGLYANGIDGEMKSVITLAAGYVFGSALTRRRAKVRELSTAELEYIIKRLEADGFGKGTD